MKFCIQDFSTCDPHFSKNGYVSEKVHEEKHLRNESFHFKIRFGLLCFLQNIQSNDTNEKESKYSIIILTDFSLFQAFLTHILNETEFGGPNIKIKKNEQNERVQWFIRYKIYWARVFLLK